ncbi:MAG TPA: ABC transporter permease [Candidatus Binatia bacterium]|nr:ABC transporter permease [Candidatus Binatia bacterium]
MREFIEETHAQFTRWMLHLRREPFSLAFNLLNPVILLVFMGSAFQGIARGPLGGDYRGYLLPGILALTTFGNSMAGGIPLLFDRENGSLMRLMSAPISRASIILSRFLAVNVSTMLQSLLILVLGIAFGVKIATGIGGVLALLGVGLLLGFGITAISLMLAFRFENHGDFFAVIGLTSLPLTFLSSAFVPLDSLPAWMRAIALVNPMTYAIDAMRALILTGWNSQALVTMVAVLVVFDAVMLWLGSRVIGRHLG